MKQHNCCALTLIERLVVAIIALLVTILIYGMNYPVVTAYQYRHSQGGPVVLDEVPATLAMPCSAFGARSRISKQWPDFWAITLVRGLLRSSVMLLGS